MGHMHLERILYMSGWVWRMMISFRTHTNVRVVKDSLEDRFRNGVLFELPNHTTSGLPTRVKVKG